MLTTRQQQILSCIVREYTENSMPVGSGLVCENRDIDASSATVRSEMGRMEEEGYLTQPHTSGGRVPTAKAYTFFVDSFDEKFNKKNRLPTKLKNIHLGEHEYLKQISEYAGAMIINCEPDEILKVGLDTLLEEPEFNNVENFQKLVRKLESLEDSIDKFLKNTPEEGIEVFIGKENPLHLENCSMIIAAYKTSSNHKGILALLGPVRMRYDKNIALMESLVELLS